ncbi:hypothetical protein BaOVIS_031820 [Babesia ovis]|uniref:Uncharacterized protein n=1 Tax=Babesia ovis TaxID=5869 RepID=A0A9W5TDD8_BABOV|nr:hypothetical protein BaOVIS_031820 [Babesia ovis]
MGKKGSRISSSGNAKCVKKTTGKGLSTPSRTTGTQAKRGDTLFKWLSFELRLLQRLIYRNKNQHRSSLFMKSVCTSVRFLKRFTGFIKQKRSSLGLSTLRHDGEFNHLFYLSLKSVLSASVEISRIHAHHFHVPLISVLFSIYSRLLYLLKRLPDSLDKAS